MSSEAADLTVALRKRHSNATRYWAFFTKEEAAFWNFVDRGREDLTPQGSLSQEVEQAHNRLSVPASVVKRYTHFSTSPRENCMLRHS